MATKTASKNGSSAKSAIDEVAPALNKQWQIDMPKVFSFDVTVRGTAPLLVNRFANKTSLKSADPKFHGLEATLPNRGVPDAEKIANNAAYWIDRKLGRAGMAHGAFLKCILSAKKAYPALQKVDVGFAIQVEGAVACETGEQVIPITYERWAIREDVGKTSGMGRAPIVIYRPEFFGWTATFTLVGLETHLSPKGLLTLLAVGGARTGLGEWRPEKKGVHGTFEVAEVSDVRVAPTGDLARLLA